MKSSNVTLEFSQVDSRDVLEWLDMSIKSFFKPLPEGHTWPTEWNRKANATKKQPKRKPGQPRKIREPQRPAIDSDCEEVNQVVQVDSCSEAADDSQYESCPKRVKHLCTLSQKRRVVSYAMEKSVAAAERHFGIPRTTMSKWKVSGYFE